MKVKFVIGLFISIIITGCSAGESKQSPFSDTATDSNENSTELFDNSDTNLTGTDSSKINDSGDTSFDSDKPTDFDSDTTINRLTIEENNDGYCTGSNAIEWDHPGFTGTGYVNTPNETGTEIRWEVMVQDDVSVTFEWRYASNSGGDRITTLKINDVKIEPSLSFPETGGWDQWSTVTAAATLKAGVNSITLLAETEFGLANIDNLTITGNGISEAYCELPIDSNTTPATALKHPGVLNSSVELALIKTNIEKNKEPWKSAFDKLQNSDYSKTTYTQKAYDWVECGSYNNPNIGCSQMVDDGMAVYSLALMWYFTGNQSFADKAIEIMDDWSSLYEGNTDSNARLVVAWAAPWYVNGAEILRYTNAGWSDSSIIKFTEMLDKFLPYVLNDERPENNWIQSRIEAHMAIAVFKNDLNSLKNAIDRWKFWLPIYLYQTTDGATPVNPPNRTTVETVGIWESSANSTVFVNGLCMETCRDLGHLGLGFGSMMYAAEIAWQQGVDLFSPYHKRLTDFMELHGSWMTGHIAVPSNICDGTVKAALADTSGISPPDGGGRKTWEIAYNHLAGRLKYSLPYTLEMINDGRPANATHWVTKWETLTHGDLD
ncbi:MAG: alginate lyase family protein [Deltaproteobacteria bacterium]|nr:alginate lyase family protein [Deltaproteobacteria bacterium]